MVRSQGIIPALYPKQGTSHCRWGSNLYIRGAHGARVGVGSGLDIGPDRPIPCFSIPLSFNYL